MTILKTALEKLFRLREKSTQRHTGSDPDAPRHDPHEKPFLDHLEDLRLMFMKMIVVQIVFTIAAFIFNKLLFHWMFIPLKLPYKRLLGDDGSVLFDHVKFEFLAPQEGFMLSLKVCFFAGLIFALPLHSFFLAQFVLPGLTDKEKKYIIPGVAVGFFLFLTGACFAFFGALPYAFNFLAQYNADIVEQDGAAIWRTGYYIGFVSQVVIIFGLAFELPVVTTILVKLQILTYRTMASSRSFAILILCVLSAVLTPPDPFTMVMLAVPMIFLYEICIWIAYFIDKRRAAAEAVEEGEYQAWLAKQENKDKANDDDPGRGPKALTDGDDRPDGPSSPVPAAEQPYDYDADHAGMDDFNEDDHEAHKNPWPEDDDHYIDHDHPNYDPANFEKYGDYYGNLDDIECPEDRRNVARARKARELAKNTEALSNLLIDINNCPIDELKSLPGIGPKLAQDIIDRRPYGSPTELMEVPGISESKYAIISLRIFAG